MHKYSEDELNKAIESKDIKFLSKLLVTGLEEVQTTIEVLNRIGRALVNFEETEG